MKKEISIHARRTPQGGEMMIRATVDSISHKLRILPGQPIGKGQEWLDCLAQYATVDLDGTGVYRMLAQVQDKWTVDPLRFLMTEEAAARFGHSIEGVKPFGAPFEGLYLMDFTKVDPSTLF